MSYWIPGLALGAAAAPIIVPITYAPLIPVLGWTLALQWFIDEYHSFAAWTVIAETIVSASSDSASSSSRASVDQTITHAQRDQLLGQWFQNWFHTGGLCAAVSTPLTFSSSLVVLYHQYISGHDLSSTLASPGPWTLLGLILVVYHIVYGKSQFTPFKRIGLKGNEGNNTRDLAGWLEMHRKRIWFIDVPAWACFAVAAVFGIRK